MRCFRLARILPAKATALCFQSRSGMTGPGEFWRVMPQRRVASTTGKVGAEESLFSSVQQFCKRVCLFGRLDVQPCP